MVAEAVQLAEISVSAASERGTVNRTLKRAAPGSQRGERGHGEEIAKSPDGDAAQAVSA